MKLEHIGIVSMYLEEQLKALQSQCSQIRQICCKGLAASIEFADQAYFETVQQKAKRSGLILGTGENRKLVLRPPYVITKSDIDEVIAVLQKILQTGSDVGEKEF